MTPTRTPQPRRRYTMLIAALLLTATIAGLAAAIAWGGPKDIPPLASINNPFKDVDYSNVPPAQRYTARDGASLAWHSYSPAGAAPDAPQRRVVLVHGSSARGQSNHVLAQALYNNLEQVGAPQYGSDAIAAAQKIQQTLGMEPMDKPFLTNARPSSARRTQRPPCASTWPRGRRTGPATTTWK